MHSQFIEKYMLYISYDFRRCNSICRYFLIINKYWIKISFKQIYFSSTSIVSLLFPMNCLRKEITVLKTKCRISISVSTHLTKITERSSAL